MNPIVSHYIVHRITIVSTIKHFVLRILQGTIERYLKRFVIATRSKILRKRERRFANADTLILLRFLVGDTNNAISMQGIHAYFR